MKYKELFEELWKSNTQFNWSVFINTAFANNKDGHDAYRKACCLLYCSLEFREKLINDKVITPEQLQAFDDLMQATVRHIQVLGIKSPNGLRLAKAFQEAT